MEKINVEKDVFISLRNHKDAQFVILNLKINKFNYEIDCFLGSGLFKNFKESLSENIYKKLFKERKISLKAIIELRCVEKVLGVKSTGINVKLNINNFSSNLFLIQQNDNYFFIRELGKQFNNVENLNKWFFKTFNFYIEEELFDELNSLVIKNKFLGINL